MRDLIWTFVVTQLVIALVVAVAYYLLRRMPNLGARRRALDDITDVPLFLKETLAELRHSLREMRTQKERKTKLQDRSEASRGLGLGWAQKLILKVFLIAVWLGLFEVEAGIGVILNVAANLLDLGREYAAVAGPLMALGAFLVTHAVILTIHRADRARRTWRWLRNGTAVSLACVALAWVVFMSGRTIDPSDLTAAMEMERTLSHALYALALLNAIAAAFCGGIVILLIEDAFLDHEIARVEQMIRDYGQHILDVVREAQEQKVELPDDIEEQLDDVRDVITPPAVRKPSSLVTVASAVLLMLCASGVLAQQEDGTAGRATPVATPAAQVPVLAAGTCELVVDVSTSTDPAAREEAVDLFAQHVGRFIEVKGCRLFRASGFSADPYTPLAEVGIPAVEEVTDACVTSPAPNQGAVEIWFPTLTDARHKRAAIECEARVQAKRTAAAGRRRQAITEVARQARLVVQASKPRGKCTALDLSIALARARSQEVVVVTDGFQSCVNPDAVVAEDRAGYGWLNVVLIPTTSPEDQRWAELTGRMVKLQRQYPGAQVRPYNELALGWSR